MAKYQAWFVYQDRDDELDRFLQNIGYPPVNVDPRERISLRWIDNAVQFCAREPDRVFDQIPKPGAALRAITSAPPEQVKLFHNQVLWRGSGRYRILCDSEEESDSSSPYNRRFLTLVNDATGVGYKPDEKQKVESRDPGTPNLWLRPELITLDENQVGYCFGLLPGVEFLKGSFLLPPTRVLDEDEADDGFELRPPSPRTYFEGALAELRDALLKLLGQPPEGSKVRNRFSLTPDPEFECEPSALYDPTMLTMLRLCDKALLRDVFLDGGSLRLAGDDGKPTRIILQFANAGIAAEGYRSRFVLDPAGIGGPEWAKDLAWAVRMDMAALLPDNGLELDSGTRSGDWDWELAPLPSETNHTGGPEGSWTYLRAVQERLPEGSSSRDTFWTRVLSPTAGKSNRPDPDHDLAERLFLDVAWRCPWKYAQEEFDPWREAFREILADELTKGSLTPEERADKWNVERNAPNFRCHARSWQQLEYLYFLSYSGPHDPDSVVLWRLLLPWRSIVSARTIILDRPGRSLLGGKFVLA